MTSGYECPAVGSRKYVIAKLAEKNITQPHQLWRAKYNGSGIEYACPGPNHSPDIQNYLKLVAVEDILNAAYKGDSTEREIAALEREHAKLLAPVLLQLRRSHHAGTKGAGIHKSPMTKAVSEAVKSLSNPSRKHILQWLKDGGSAYCDYENGDYIFSDGREEKRHTLKSINQAIRRELKKNRSQ
jgi:hypothetical protein